MKKFIATVTSLLLCTSSLANNLSYNLNSVVDKDSELVTKFEVCESYKGVEIECKKISDRSYSFHELEDISLKAQNRETGKKIIFGGLIVAGVVTGFGAYVAAANGAFALTAASLSGYAGTKVGLYKSFSGTDYEEIRNYTSMFKSESESTLEAQSPSLSLDEVQAFKRLLWEVDNCRLTRRGERCQGDFAPLHF